MCSQREAVETVIADIQPDVIIHQLTAIPVRIDPRNLASEFAMTNRLRTEGTQILMNAAKSVGVKRFISQSVSFQYHPDDDGIAVGDGPALQ